MKNLRVSLKLLILVIIAIVSLCLIGFTGYYYLNRSTDTIDDMYSNNLQSVMWLNEMRAHARAVEADTLNLMITQDENEKKNQAIAELNKDQTLD